MILQSKFNVGASFRLVLYALGSIRECFFRSLCSNEVGPLLVKIAIDILPRGVSHLAPQATTSKRRNEMARFDKLEHRAIQGPDDEVQVDGWLDFCPISLYVCITSVLAMFIKFKLSCGTG